MVNLNLAGGLRSSASPTVVDIGGGVRVVGRVASVNTPKSAGPLPNSQNSIPTVPDATNPEMNITREQHQENWAQILIKTALEFRNAGGTVKVGYAKGAMVLVLPGVFYCERCGQASLGDACHHCASGGTGGGTE